MLSNNLQGMRVAILATDGIEMSELAEPRKALEEAGAKTTLIAPKPGKIQAMQHDEKASSFDVDMTLDKARPEDFDAVLIPGGALNADLLRVEKQAQEFVRPIDQTGETISGNLPRSMAPGFG